MKCKINPDISFAADSDICRYCEHHKICFNYNYETEPEIVDDPQNEIIDKVIETELPATVEKLLMGMLDLCSQINARCERIEHYLKINPLNN